MALFDWLFPGGRPSPDFLAEEERRNFDAAEAALDGPYASNHTLYTYVEGLVRAAQFPEPIEFAQSTALRLVEQCLADSIPPPHNEIVIQMAASALAFYVAERFQMIPPNPAVLGTHGETKTAGEWRDNLLALMVKSVRPQITLEVLSETIVASYLAIAPHLPSFAQGPAAEPEDEEALIHPTIPLIDVLPRVADIIESALRAFDSDAVRDLRLFRHFKATLKANVERISPSREIFPSQYRGSPREVVTAYLKNTPLERVFFQSRIPFEISTAQRLEHTAIVAGTGWGKSQFIQHSILSDLRREDPPALIVIDSQGEMLSKIQRLALFARLPMADRIVIIDPEDDLPPALNMFAMPSNRLASYSRNVKEQVEAGTIELFNYIFGAIAAELTSRQNTTFAFVTRLMLAINGATIHTLRELFEDGANSIDASPFAAHIRALDATSQGFFENQFFTKAYSQTRAQIARRLYGVLQVPSFDRMFSTKENKLDMFEAMQAGKVVLVNTSKALLKGDASAVFGRFMIAQTLRAAFERVAVQHRRPAFLIVDEAADYFDESLEALLSQARKFNLGVLIAHQHLDQLSPALRASVAANTSIKFAGGVSDKDARALAPDMRTTADFITGQRKTKSWTNFACYVRNYTTTAVSLSIPFGTMEAEPEMSAEEFRQLRTRNRELYAASPDVARPAATSPGASAPIPPAAPAAAAKPLPDADDWRS